MKLMGIDTETTTVNIYDSFMQSLAVSSLLLVVFHYTSVIGVFTFLGCLFSPLFLVAFFYMFWYYKTIDHPYKGGYNTKMLRNLTMWKNFRDYFPVKVHRTQELDTTKNYVFGLHPSGIINAGSMSVFGYSSNDFDRYFSGLTPHLVVDKSRFLFPFTRELLLFTGISADDPKTFDWVLNNKGLWSKRGQVVVVPLGSPEELLEKKYDRITLFIRSRKDFIRAALKTGSSLVPVFQFGESDLYDMNPSPKGSILRRIQEFVRNITMLPLPILSGRVLTKESCGLLPKRRQINVVFGRPIEIKKVDYPTEEQTQQVFEQYIKELENIFNEYKGRFHENKNATLVIQ